MKTYDVIIIGAGVTGTSIARELSRYQLNIALLEKEEELAFGVSKSNSGIIHPGIQHDPQVLKAKLCVQGNLLTRRISKELGLDFKKVGELVVVFGEKDIPRLLKLKKEAKNLKVPGLKIVRSSWLRENEPNLSHNAVAALYAPTAGIISPYRLVYALAENALQNKAEIYTKCEVTGIKAKSIFEIITRGKKIFKARYVINAAGLYADKIANLAGINDFRIQPRKGEEFILDKKKEHLTNHLLFPLPTKTSKGILVIKTADGNPMVGPTAEDCADKEDLSTSDEGLKKVLNSVKQMIPSISERDIIAYFAGLRPVALRPGSGLPTVALRQDSGLPAVAGEDFIIRHEDKVPGMITVAGIQSPGLTAAPAIALLVAGILKNNGLILKKKKIFYKQRKKPIHLFAVSLTKTAKLIKKDPAYGDIVCRCEMVSDKEIKDAIRQGAKTLDGIKFRTRAQAGRCHGSFCTTRIMKMLSEERNIPLAKISKKGAGSEIINEDRQNG